MKGSETRSMIRRIIVCALIAFGCAGCGSGIVIDRFDGTAATMVGVPYNLPMTAFTLTITRRVTGCGDHLKGAVDVQTVSSKTLDPAAMFTLHSDGWLSTSDIKSTFAPDLTTTALNTSSEGAAATVISNVVSAVAAIAPLVAAAGGGGEQAPEVCTDEVKAAVTEIATLKETVDKETNDLVAATDLLTVLSNRVTALRNATVDSIKKALAHVADAKKTLAEAQAKLADHQKKLAEDLKLTSDTQIVNWPPDGTALKAGPYSIPPEVLDKWATVAHPDNAAKRFDVYLQLERTGPVGIDAAKVSTVPRIDISRGIPVRFAVPGRLKVCVANVCAPGDKGIDKPFEGPVLQLGLVYAAPAKGGTFKSETMALTTDANGAPSSLQVMEKVAAAAAAAGVLKDTATQAAGIPNAVNAAKLAKIKAQTDRLTAETALATARANNADADVLAPMQAQTALAQAALAQINADAALKSAQEAQGAAGN